MTNHALDLVSDHRADLVASEYRQRAADQAAGMDFREYFVDHPLEIVYALRWIAPEDHGDSLVSLRALPDHALVALAETLLAYDETREAVREWWAEERFDPLA